MKKNIIWIILCLSNITILMAQESIFVGTWKGVYQPYFANGQNWVLVIRISQVGKDYQVRVKQCNQKDSTNWHYFNGCYDIKEIDSLTLQWYSKSSSTGISDRYKELGGVRMVSKCYSQVKSIAGALHYKTNYWSDYQILDKNGNIVESVNEKNNDAFIDEAILYKDDENW